MTVNIMSGVTKDGSAKPASFARIAQVFSLELTGPSDVPAHTFALRPSAHASGLFRMAATACPSLPLEYGLTFPHLIFSGTRGFTNAFAGWPKAGPSTKGVRVLTSGVERGVLELHGVQYLGPKDLFMLEPQTAKTAAPPETETTDKHANPAHGGMQSLSI